METIEKHDFRKSFFFFWSISNVKRMSIVDDVWERLKFVKNNVFLLFYKTNTRKKNEKKEKDEQSEKEKKANCFISKFY